MPELPQKPTLELGQGIEVEGAFDTEKTISGSDRRDDNVNYTNFQEPESINVTGKEEAKPEAEGETVEKEDSTEEVESNLFELRKMMGLETKEEKENESKAEEEPAEEAEEEEVEEEGEEEPVAEEKPKKRLKKKEPAPSYEDMAKLAGQAAAEALKQSDANSRTEQAPAVDSVELDEEDQGTYEIFNQMEKSNPDKYKGISKKFAGFVDSSKEYQKEWMAKNPDDEFDPESDEHAAFYEKNEPQYTQKDFKKAEKRVDMADVLGEVEQKYQDKIEELEDKLSRRTESQPQARETAESAIKEMVAQVSPEIEKIIDEKGLEEAEKADPLVYDKISQAAETISTMVYEIEQNKSRNGTFTPNSRNETHKYVSDFIKGREQYVKSLPASSQTWNGKSFATNSEFNRMSNSDKQKHWTIDSTLLKNELVKEISQTVNADIEQSRKMLERYGVPSAGKTAQTKKAKKSKTVNKPASPESATQETNSPNLTTGTEEISSSEKELANLMWG